MNVRNAVIRTSLWLGAALFLSVTTAGTLWAQTGQPPKNKPAPEAWYESGAGTVQPGLDRTADPTDRAVARIWISGLDVRTHNWGDMGSYVWGFTPFYYTWSGGRHAGHYSASMALAIGPGAGIATAQVHQSDGRYTSSSQMDWEAKDGARGTQYASPPATWGSYPLFAHTDQPTTWPEAGWPAPEATSAVWLGTEMWPKWTRRADLEAYAEFNDDGAARNVNSRTLGIDGKKRILGYGGGDAVFFQWELTNNGSYSLTECYVGFFADLAGPVYNISVGTPDWDPDYQMHYTEGAHYNATTGTHDDNSGNQLPWFGYMFLESPTGSFKTDAAGDTVDSPSTTMTRVALLDYADWLQSMDENLYGALSAETSYMTPTEAATVWKTDPPILIQDRDDFLAVYPPGDPVGYFASGPFDFGPGESIDFVMAYVAGETKPEMYNTADFALTTYRAKFQTSGPPPSPALKAAGTLAGTHAMVYDSNVHAYQIYYAPSGGVTLFWDGTDSEQNLDAITGNMEFEGYRIYKSTNRGGAWGQPITNSQGSRIGWTPLAQYDIANDIKGPDLNGGGKYLGDDTGLVHSYTDIDVYDGYEYWYAITAYDYAPPLQSFEGAIGNDPNAVNVISVITGSSPPGYTEGLLGSGTAAGTTLDLYVPVDSSFQPSISVALLDESIITGDAYSVDITNWYVEADGDTIRYGGGLTLTNTTESLDLIDPPITAGMAAYGADATPITEGFRLVAGQPNGGVGGVYDLELTTDVVDTTSLSIWFTQAYMEAAGPAANRANTSEFMNRMEYRFTGYVTAGGDTNWAVDVNTRDWVIAAFELWDIDTNTRLIPILYAWEGDGYWHTDDYQVVTPVPYFETDGVTRTDFFALHPVTDAVYWGYDTTNPLSRSDWAYRWAPNEYDPELDPAINPYWDVGDVWTLTPYKTLKALAGESYAFSTTAPVIDPAEVTVDDVKVVPNPYYIFEQWDRNINARKIQFTNVPANSDIDIYTLSGELVASLEHGAGYNADKIGVVDWNLWTYEFTEAAYGLYIYVVTDADGNKKVGKFAIIR